MLTNKDLEQIQKVVQVAVHEEIEPLKKDVQVLRKDVNNLQKDMKTVQRDIVQIRKDMKTIINFFDQEYLELRHRIDRIEEVLNLPPLNQ
jgi:predicted  nucleic acid-binding Zn-ribbon protein